MSFYFYHLIPKNLAKNIDGIISPMYMYEHGLYDLFDKATQKYRNRIINDWKYYDKKPEDLTREEIIEALIKFRGKHGLNQIYLFKYPPYMKLGKNMEEILKNKFLFKIDIDDPRLQFEQIDWGFYLSHSDNKKLTRSYYENVSIKDYFKMYDDNIEMRFKNLNHISVSPKNGIIPFSYCDKIAIPVTRSDVVLITV